MIHRINLPTQSVSSDWQEWLQQHQPQISERSKSDGAHVFLFSQYVKQIAKRQPDLLLHLLTHDCLETEFFPQLAQVRWQQPELAMTESEFMSQIRRFRTYHMLWIYWRDLSGQAALEETCRHISWLADFCLTLTHDWALQTIRQQMSLSGDELLPLIVIGMGKYGSEELNVSSDIDLIFCFTDEQEVPSGVRSLTLFYTKVGQLIIKLLDQRTADGFVFRVDMRLRPYGDSGALVMSESALESYYLEQGRDWERFALIKGRFITGSEDQQQNLYSILKPFVFRRYIDFSVLESPREMKRLIQHEIRRRNLGDNIKLGAGGIREIEFITQALQLIHGGKDPDLQGRSLLLMLDRIAVIGLLDGESVQNLKQAYYFLRLLEHRIQAYKDEQTQTIPADERRQELLAQSMGFEAWQQCSQALAQHRNQVHAIFTDLFESSDQSLPEQADIIYNDVWLAAFRGDDVSSLIAQTDFISPPEIEVILTQFARLRVVQNSPARAEQMLHHLLPAMLSRLKTFENQSILFQRLIDLILAIISRTAYLELLKENVTVLEQVMTLCDKSAMVADFLTDYPFVMDELINPVLLTSDSADEFNEQLKQSINRIPLDDIEARMDVLREVRQLQLLRLSLADIAGVMDVTEIGQFLSDMAVSVIRETVNMAWQIMIEKYGPLPSNKSSLEVVSPGFCIVAYGKLGGREMGYSSDLDLVFLYRNTKESTTGPVELDNKRFYIRLAQKIIHLLSTRTRTGVLYEVDMRLRPSGNSGLLVTDIAAFEQYQHNDAWTWEHQALIKARPVLGDTVLAEQFNQVRATVLAQHREPTSLKNDIVEMRQKMQKHTIERLQQHEVDLKQTSGGLADIEFLSQYFTLQHAEIYPALLEATNTTEILRVISETDLLSPQSSKLLLRHYLMIRETLNRLSLQKQNIVTIPTQSMQDDFANVVSLWNEVFHTSD